MEFVKWTENNLHLLGKDFLSRVIANMQILEGVFVRFGERGKGIRPNYQITSANGTITTIRGSSHKAYELRDKFNDRNISCPFDLFTIQKEYESE